MELIVEPAAVENGPSRKVTKFDAATNQLNAAIEHFYKGDWECAITLAGAVEGQLESPEESQQPALFEALRRMVPDGMSQDKWIGTLNEEIYWLKHKTSNLGLEIELNEFKTVVVLFRALTKFMLVHRRTSVIMEQFAMWAAVNGHGLVKRINPEAFDEAVEFFPMSCSECKETILRRRVDIKEKQIVCLPCKIGRGQHA